MSAADFLRILASALASAFAAVVVAPVFSRTITARRCSQCGLVYRRASDNDGRDGRLPPDRCPACGFHPAPPHGRGAMGGDR